jgi:hypothetical protein
MNNLPRVSRVPRFLLAALALAAAAPCFAQNPATRNAADPAVAAAEARTVIPAVEWKQAAFTNVLADVEAKANKAAPAGSPRVRIRLDEAVTNELPTVTMRASGIELFPLLSMLADMTGLEHRIQEGQIVFGLPSAPAAAAPDAWPAPPAAAPAASSAQPAQSAAARALLEDPNLIIHRQYPIRGAKTTAADATKLKEWFAGKGVAWPEGSSLSLPVPGTLTVANTRENLDRIEYILRQLPSQQPKP